MRAFTINYSDIRQCPQHRWDPQHYNEDGTCKCVRDERADKPDDNKETVE